MFRIIEVDAASGRARAVISEEPKTFFAYSSKKFRHDVADGREVIWMSERDGWNHLYLYDGTNGTVNGQITKGRWPVRSVVHVDDEKRQIWFSASGMYPGKDPYFTHYYRIDFDGSDLTALTEADANHTVVFSPDMSYYVDTYSRVDAPPVAELRRSSDRSLILALEKADITALMEAGWQPPDITRVGLYGNSAGGQNALGALLFFPDFYKAAVSSSGCHDNRMDKIWWNEQWMGWPIESQYAESSTSTTPTASG